MLTLSTIRRWLQRVGSEPFIQNVGWLSIAELVNRILRLGTTVTLARVFSSQDYGLIAIFYTVFDITSVFTLRGGIGAKIIQADEADVEVICNTSYWLNWILCIAIAILQCAAAVPLAHFYQDSALILPICFAALYYLTLPLYLINLALLERQNQLKVTALCNATHSIINNGVMIGLALMGAGIWSVAIAMVVSTPIWIVITWRNHPWRPPQRVGLEKWQTVVHFGKNLLGVDLLQRVRMNFDYLVVGKLLGLEALGLYFFAFNAGIGISMSIVSMFMSAFFPYICAVKTDAVQFKDRYLSTAKKVILIAAAISIGQSMLAPFYVPIIFGQQWIPAIPVLIWVSLSVVPRVMNWATVLLLNAIDKTAMSVWVSFGFTVVFALMILLSVSHGIVGVAIAVFITHWAILPLVSACVTRYVFAGHNINNLST